MVDRQLTALSKTAHDNTPVMIGRDGSIKGKVTGIGFGLIPVGLLRNCMIDRDGSIKGKIAQDARHDALPSRDQLVSAAGRPKDDLAFGLWKMSTGYKAVLNLLDECRGLDNRFEKPSMNSLSHLQGLLGKLDKAATDYLASEGHTRKEAIGGLKTKIDAEKKIVADLSRQASGGAQFPPRLSMAEVRKLAREGIPLSRMSDIPPRIVHEAFDNGTSVRDKIEQPPSKLPTHLLDNFGRRIEDELPPIRLADYGRFKFSSEETQQLIASGISAEEADEKIREAGCTVAEFITFKNAFSKEGFFLHDALPLMRAGIDAQEAAKTIDETGCTVAEFITFAKTYSPQGMTLSESLPLMRTDRG
jgi:hypothetical protein